MKKILLVRLSLLVLCLGLLGAAARAQTSMTYQGKLNDGGAAANGTYDFTFRLFSVASGGAQIGSDVVREDVQVTNGIFTVVLDFGSAPFTSTAGNFLDIAVRPGASTGGFTPLAPRLPVTNSPYSVKSLTADNAVNATNAANATNAVTATTATNALSLGGVAANQYVLTTDPRLSGANYINNTTTTQPSSNFNISGSGTLGGTLSANVVNAATQYNIFGVRILTAPDGTANLFAGIGAGIGPGTGVQNSAFGYYAGELSPAGGDNSFFGYFAGRSTVGSGNSFFGSAAGRFNVGGSGNTFVGTTAGLANTVGSNNTLLGALANTGANNLNFATAIGAGAVVSSNNTLVLGRNLDTVQIPGNLNVAGTLTGTVSNATTANNALNLGGVAANQYLTTAVANTSFIQNSTALQNSSNFNISGTGLVGGRLGVGLTNPTFKLQVIDPSNTGLRVQTNTAGGTVASFGGSGEFSVDAPGVSGGRFRIAENGNVGIGGTIYSDPSLRLSVGGTGIIRSVISSDSNAGLALFLNSTPKWSVATVGSGQFQIFNDAIGSNAIWIDSATNNVGIGTTNTNSRLFVDGGNSSGLTVTTNNAGNYVAQFGGTGVFAVDDATSGGGRLRVTNNGTTEINIPGQNGNTSIRLNVNGSVKLNMIPGVGTSVCLSNLNTLVACGVSSIRYKDKINNFSAGLNLIRRLQPVSFSWKSNGATDLGLIAEEVAKEEPLLANYTEKGEVQGVRYDRIGVVLINAIREQQEQIEAQKKQIDGQNELIKRQSAEFERQKAAFEALKKLVCAGNPAAEICREQK